MTDSRASRVHGEALTLVDPDSRVSRVHGEALSFVDPDTIVSRVHGEALVRHSTKVIKYVGAPSGVLMMKHPDGNWYGVTYL